MRDTIGFKILRAVVIVLLGLFVALPLFVMITSSIKLLQDVQGDFTWWPTRSTVLPFFDMWKTVPLGRYFVNSIIVSSAATVFSIIIAIFASFAVSRYRFRGRSAFTTTILSTQMFPGVLFLLPLFMIFVNIKSTFGIQLVGTRSGLVLMYLTFSLPFSVVSSANVLLLDEPTNNLDPASREEILRALGTFAGAVVLVTHDEGAVEALGPNRILLLPDGDEDLWSEDYLELVTLA